jgi:hypothetical protein
MKTLTLAAVAVSATLVLTAPAFATFTCKNIVTDGGQKVTDIFGNVTQGNVIGFRPGVSPEVFYGDVGCGPAGSCVMPSIVGGNDDYPIEYKTIVMKIGELVEDLPDTYQHQKGVLDIKDTAKETLIATYHANKDKPKKEWTVVYVPVYNYGAVKDGACGGGGH